MGKLLQIRVSAWTFSEGEVEKTWPSLWKLIWGDGGDAVPKKGVMELAHAVFNAVQAGLVTDDQRDALRDGAEKVEKLHRQIEDELGSWQAKDADKLTYQLEDELDALEDIAEKF